MSTSPTVALLESTLFERAVQFAKKLVAGPAAGDANGDLWQLYRMTRGVDSVRPGVTRKLDMMARRRAGQAG
ncbi:hypothetical protein ACFPOU_15935 [Massilia jejuensis]|uniref:Acyl-CoA dehydrogenase n=1 Tax=Massilia jejuensis TaxID=648894 RepID=A0ABW0PM97_9BURK